MPVSLGEWRVRIGRFVHWVRENDIRERKENFLKERIRRLKLLHKRLLEKKEKSEDECEPKPNDLSVKVDNAPNDSNIINNDTTNDSHKEESGRSESTIKENTTQTESTTYHKSNGTDSTFPSFFTLLLSFSLLLSLIFFFIFNFSNLLESDRPFLEWSGECSWRSTCLIIIIVCSSLAYIVLSYVIKNNEDLQDNLVLIGDENAKAESTTKVNNTPSRTPIEENNNQPMKVNIAQAEYTIRSGIQKVLSDGKHSISSQIPSSLKGTTDDPVMQESTCLPEMILVKAGDVEQNPGPFDRSADIQEKELLKLAQDVSPSKYVELCIELGVSYSQSQVTLDKRHLDVTQSLMEIFCKWKNRQRDGTDCRKDLAAALCDVKLDTLGDKISRGGYLPQEAAPTASISSEKDPLTTEQVTRCGDDFKTFYRTQLCKIKTDPLDFSLVLEFERIYTDLVLLRNERGATKKTPFKYKEGGATKETPLKYEELLKTKVNEELPKRLMVEGEGGAGKTTFCSKMAWDWTNGADEFQEFVWVLVIPLRDIESNQTVGDIAKTYLSDSNSVQPHEIDEYILANPSKVFIIFDGLDEYDGDLVTEGNDIAKIIRWENFKECRVLVTTRPWKADQIKSNAEFMRAYAFIAVAGFDEKHISIYINKYFSDDPQASQDLNKLLEDNDVIKHNMAYFPIYIAMLCILWRDSDSQKRELIRRLKTFSQLFQEIITMLKEHYVSKRKDLDMETVPQIYEQLGLSFTEIGKVALFGVMDKKLGKAKSDFSSCKKAMDTCCQVGVLSKEKQLVPKHDRHKNTTPPVTVNVFFPHKLFQEYFAGIYLASLFESDHEQYEKMMDDVIQRAEEFRYLLYFTACQSKNIAIDVTNRLINIRQYIHAHILVDVTFEAYDEDAAKVVGKHLFAKQTSLEIDDEMSAHTVSGYIFIMEKLTMETLILSRRSCGPTVSRDLADVICSSTALTALEFNGTMLHDDFYGTLEGKVKTSKVERLSLKLMEISDEHASRKLARFSNNLPRLKDLTLQDNRFDRQFYTELASGACSVEVERLSLISMEIFEEHASCNLALFLNNLPRLRDLTLQDNRFDGRFYTELASGACSVEVGSSGHSICKLHLDHQCHNDLLQYGFAVERLFPMLGHLCFTTSQTVSPNIVGSFAHSGLEELSFATENRYGKTKEDEECHVPLVGDPSSLEQVLLRSFPLLTNITFNNLVIGNERCKVILSSLKQHQHLENLYVIHCYTDEELDPIASANNMENGMKVNIQHDQTQKRLECMKMSSSLVDALGHRTSIQELILTQETIFSNAWCSEENQRTINLKIQKLSIDISGTAVNDQTASRDLARFLCLQPCPTDLTINGSNPHDDFYQELSRLASSSKVQNLSILVCNLEEINPFASRDLAKFLCLQPCLVDLTIRDVNWAYDTKRLHDEFYHELARLASSSKIQKLSFKDKNSERNDPSASRDLATFLCLQPCLTDLTINRYNGYIHDDFYQELSRLASSSKVQKLSVGGCNLERNKRTASRNLAKFLRLLPCLTDLSLKTLDDDYKHLYLHDDFYQELVCRASFSKIQKLSLEDLNTERNPSASRDLAMFLCLQPRLTDLMLKDSDNECKYLYLHDDFYKELAHRASSSKVQKLSIRGCNLERNKRTASRDLAKFLCLLPHLTDLSLKDSDDKCKQDDFYQELARRASSSKNHFFNKKSEEFKQMDVREQCEYIRRFVHPTLSEKTTCPTSRACEPQSSYQWSVQQQREYSSVVTPPDLDVHSTSGINAQSGKITDGPSAVTRGHLQPNNGSKDDNLDGTPRKRKKKTNRQTPSS